MSSIITAIQYLLIIPNELQAHSYTLLLNCNKLTKENNTKHQGVKLDIVTCALLSTIHKDNKVGGDTWFRQIIDHTRCGSI